MQEQRMHHKTDFRLLRWNPLKMKNTQGMRLLEHRGWQHGKHIETVVVHEQEPSSGHKLNLLCSLCLHPIVSKTEKIDVNGAHQHTFANPHGVVYTVGCFALAPGCLSYRQRSKEFSWFQGYAWQIAICRNCHTHLGWRFEADTDQFFALVVSRLVEEQLDQDFV